MPERGTKDEVHALMERKLRRIEGYLGGRLEPHFQPQIRGDLHTVVGCEALARVRTPYGKQSPAYVTRKLSALGSEELLAFDEVMLWRSLSIAHQRGWNTHGVEISINVSAGSFRALHLVERLGYARDAARFKGHVVLEVLEDEMLPHARELNCIVADLQEAGFHVALDDFGGHNTRFRDLGVLDVDIVKIDRSLLEHIRDAARQQDCVQMRRRGSYLASMVRMAQHDIGCRVFIEGIESEGFARLCASLGADALQGYHFGRPVADFHLTAPSVDGIGMWEPAQTPLTPPARRANVLGLRLG